MSTSSLLQFLDAKNLILKEIASIKYNQSETVTLSNAVNRIASSPIISPMNVPSFNNSAMDGYVVRKQDIEYSSSLPLVGSICAGDQQQIDWPQHSCLRIMTGAKVPDDAYAVIMQEHVELKNDHVIFNIDTITEGQNIRYVGESVKFDEIIFHRGEKLTIPKLSTLATLGIDKVSVVKALKVAIFSTGNELTPIGEPLKSNNSIYDRNRFTLHLMLNSLGCEVIDLGIIKDDLTLISETLHHAAEIAELVVTSGGVSVGDADYTKKALAQIGQVNFWKIAMKPGKPFAFGRIGNALFCGLPGNPVSTLVTFYHLVRPLILGLYGQKTETTLGEFKVKSLSNIKKSVGRIDFQRGYLYVNEMGELVVVSTGEQGSHISSSFNKANCFIILESQRGDVQANEYVTIELFDTCLL